MNWLKKNAVALGALAALVGAAAAVYAALDKPASSPPPNITGVVLGDVSGDGVAVGSRNTVTIERTRGNDNAGGKQQVHQ